MNVSSGSSPWAAVQTHLWPNFLNLDLVYADVKDLNIFGKGTARKEWDSRQSSETTWRSPPICFLVFVSVTIETAANKEKVFLSLSKPVSLVCSENLEVSVKQNLKVFKSNAHQA